MNTEEILHNWMSYLKDEVRLTEAIIPGSHNAGSYGMNISGCCQDDDMYVQAYHGVRYFCIRLDTLPSGKIVFSHGPTKGEAFEDGMIKLAKAIFELKDEFFILDIREYYPQRLLGKNLTFSAKPETVDSILEKHLQPSENALCGFGHISSLTMGAIRKSGKKFLLLNYKGAYRYSENFEHIFPWDKKIYGSTVNAFVRDSVKLFDRHKTKGLYWFQMQRTPTFGAIIAVLPPKLLEKILVPKLNKFFDNIENTPRYLARANILCGDFMTWGTKKCKRIIAMNLTKDTIIPERREEFAEKVR